MGKNQTTAGARQRARRQAKLKKHAPRIEKNKKYTSAAKSIKKVGGKKRTK